MQSLSLIQNYFFLLTKMSIIVRIFYLQTRLFIKQTYGTFLPFFHDDQLPIFRLDIAVSVIQTSTCLLGRFKIVSRVIFEQLWSRLNAVNDQF